MMGKNTGQNIRALDPQRRECGHGRNNTTHITHELAHCFGWKKINGQTMYDTYFKAVPSRYQCSPTGYANPDFSNSKGTNKFRPNEEFAEVFALYITNPDVLQKQPGCKQALQFFAKLFGEQAPLEEITCENRRARLASSTETQRTRSTSPTGNTGTVTFEETPAAN